MHSDSARNGVARRTKKRKNNNNNGMMDEGAFLSSTFMLFE